MLKRLLFGLLKGLVLGAAVGAIFHFGVGWRVTPGLSGYLIAMGTGATAGTVAGRPPWRRQAWLEGILKAVVGLAVGLGLHWLGRHFLEAALPFALGGAPEGTPWTDLPLLVAPAVGTIYGALVEIDNTPERPVGSTSGGLATPPMPKKAPPAPPRPPPAAKKPPPPVPKKGSPPG